MGKENLRFALTIAGSDSGGGAGIQADLKTFHQFGVFGTSAIVAVTAQNTTGVTAVHSVPVDVVVAQIDAVAADLPPHAVKTGMLATARLVGAVAAAIEAHGFRNLVVDPVMVASSGDRLLEMDAIETLTATLLPLAALVTPNIPEAELLAGISIRGPEEMTTAGQALLEMGAGAALIKGGHLESPDVVDVLITPDDAVSYRRPRLDTASTHGTGCTLAAAITAGLAAGCNLGPTVQRALAFVHRAIRDAPGLGSGHGPLNHFVAIEDV